MALAVAAMIAALGVVPHVMAVIPSKEAGAIADVDVRVAKAPTASLIAAREQNVAQLKQKAAGVEVAFDRLLGTPRFIWSRAGFLTGTNGVGYAVSPLVAPGLYSGQTDRALRLFLDDNSSLFGFGSEALASAQQIRDAVGANNGLRSLVWEQQLNGVPVFDSKLVANITRHGELVNMSSCFLPSLNTSASASPALAAEQAVASALAGMGEALEQGESVAPVVSSSGIPYESFTVRNQSAHTRLVWLPMDGETVRLAWEIYVTSRATHQGFQVLVDAASGETLVRRNLTCYISNATYNVYTSDSPSPFTPSWPAPNAGQPPVVSRTMVTTNAFSVVASPNGWINDGDNETRGNNADAFLDRNFDNLPDGGVRPQGTPARTFDFPLDLTRDPRTYTNAAVVQMFYSVNAYHDKLYDLGFTEAFGNYQRDNFGRGGLANDEITCYVQAGADVGASDNAFFTPAPDGLKGQIAMFVWSYPNPRRDGDLDTDIIFHEATHGTSWRLVGGGMALGNLQGDGMGEGWSDFYALALLSQTNDNPDAVYANVGYSTYQYAGLTENYYYGIRHFPYTTDMSKNPFTYKDIDPTQISPHAGVPRSPIYPFDSTEASEVHHQGEVWCSMLWEVRANLIRKYGGAVGNALALQLVTDGMKLAPPRPTYVEARDAILLADQVNNNGANSGAIWSGFAKRGLGVGAVSPDSDTTTGVVESYSTPGVSILSYVVGGGNGNGVIDVNECNDLSIVLKNPDSATTVATGIRATLSCTTPGVIVIQSESRYLDLPPGGQSANLTPFKVSTLPSFICGTPIGFNLVIKADQEQSSKDFIIQTGTLGSPARYNNSVPLNIPDNNPGGVRSPIVVSGFGGNIGKVTVAVHIQHTFVSDLTLTLIAPDGTTNVLASHVGGSGDNFGLGCASDATRTVFDDSAAVPIFSGTPPFLGTFKPETPFTVFNGKIGSAVNGTWYLQVADNSPFDTGTIQCWSLSVSPILCEDGGGACPGTDLAIKMSDFPRPALVGSNMVYTLTVTNRGPNEAKGVVVTHTLPGSVAFVSASTTRGSIVSGPGVVTANLGSMLASSTATITVTVLPLVAGNIVSTATVNSLEPEINPANNVATLTSLVQNPTADLMVALVGAPNPTVVGGPLTYTATVVNNGPSTASGVVITNTLPIGTAIASATVSQGVATINGNVVVCVVGAMTNGATVTASINATPLAAGTLFATSRVTGNLGDPNLANNVMTIGTVVGQAADLGIALAAQPNPVVVNGTITYQVSVTNRGPNVATAVVVNQSLSASLSVTSSNVSQGAVTIGGGTAVWSVGTIAVGATATMTLQGQSATAGTLISSASVNGAQADPNLADNSASASTVVAPPFVSIVAAGTTLTSESFLPPNGAVDLGETVTVDLRLRNAGNINNTNVVATLLSGGGVNSPSAPQTYGMLPPGGLPVGRPFTFTASGTNGGVVTATLQISDGGNALSNVVFTFALPRQFIFSNTAAISIPDSGSASPYPSTIVVSGVTGTVGQVTATLSNLNHTYVSDVDVLLVGPGGQKVVLMASAGSPYSAANATVTFSDTASQPVPAGAPIVSGTYRPANYNPGQSFPPSAPIPPYATVLSAFANLNPNGTWMLYIVDRNTGDAGQVASGWRLGITTIAPVNQIADLAVAGSVTPPTGLVGNDLVWTFTVTNRGPSVANGVAMTNLLSANLALVSAVSSQGVCTTNGNAVFCSLGGLNTNASATVTIVARPLTPGSAAIQASVSGSEIDLNLANNTTDVSSYNSLPFADVGVTLSGQPVPAIVGSKLTFTVTATNNGPGNALNTDVTLTVPLGVNFHSTTLSKGSYSHGGNDIVCHFGTLVPGESATADIEVIPSVAAVLTNTATATTQSTDTNPGNNVAVAIIPAANPAPILKAAGAVLIYESFTPPNHAVDPGETVTVALALTNSGQLPTVGLIATLQASGGVIAPSGPQNYGVIVPGGAAVSRAFTFTAPNTPGGVVVATLLLNDSAPLGSATFNFGLSDELNFSSSTPISIPDHGVAAPYPSLITASGITGQVGKVTVALNGFSHTFPSDVDVLLVGPAGQKVMLMSDAGGGFSVTNLMVGFDDASTNGYLPNTRALVSGVFKPTDYEPGDILPPPAPVDPAGSELSVFKGTEPNGNWLLYVADDTLGDAGGISGGWSLQIKAIQPVATPPVSDTPAQLAGFMNGNGVFTVTLTGNPWATYVLQGSANLSSWSSIATNTAPDTGVITFTDTGAPGFTHRFYRAIRQAP